MAKPRIFVSSTFYDLKQVRSDIERFIRDLGYEAVLNEKATIPYGKDHKLEEYCYREIELCDILISIIGGRRGATSLNNDDSISQLEFKKALDLDRPIYIFVERHVKTEFESYRVNKASGKFKPYYVDDIKIYAFLEYAFALPRNNPIFSFEYADEITSALREQFAGLFQRLIRDQIRMKEGQYIDELKTATVRLEQISTVLSDSKKTSIPGLDDILRFNHPAFDAVKTQLNIPYRVAFLDLKELDSLLNMRSLTKVDEANWDDKDTMEWIDKETSNKMRLLKVKRSLFDENGQLKIIPLSQWNTEMVKLGWHEEE